MLNLGYAENQNCLGVLQGNRLLNKQSKRDAISQWF